MRVSTRLAPITLPDDRGRPVRPGTLWQDAPVALVFIRHFG